MAINVSFVRLEMVREPAHRYNLKTRTIHGPEDADQAAREILRLDRQAQEGLCHLHARYQEQHYGRT